jgi:hypothetical protein
MDLVAGDERSILLAISVDDWAGFDDPTRFDAHLSLGGGLDPTWLDLFSRPSGRHGRRGARRLPRRPSRARRPGRAGDRSSNA